jgi:surface polysaccharide O-acyltransferase-like enzyme
VPLPVSCLTLSDDSQSDPGRRRTIGRMERLDAKAGVRNGYVDLLRAVSIVAVVLGHWLATGVRRQRGHVVGVDALSVVSWSGWLTLLLQVVPVFFLVGGYANAASWTRQQEAGELWPAWVRDRVLRLLIPTCGYVAFVALVLVAGQLQHSDTQTLEQAAWALTLHLWFLAAYLVILLLTPALYAAHRRWGLQVPVAMALLAIAIDTGVVDASWHVVGWANYLLVWGSFHQLGFSWHDGLLRGRRPWLLAIGAVTLLVTLIWWGPYPVSMVGVPGAHIENASPPSTALLAFGLAQCGLVIGCEPAVSRWLARHHVARISTSRAGALTMPVYLWHMVPVVIVSEVGFLRLFDRPVVGSGQWWQERPLWILALVVVLAAILTTLAIAARLTGRPHRRRGYRGGIAGPQPAAVALLSLGVVSATVGIGYLAVHGLAPAGRVDVIPLLTVALGTLFVAASGASSAAALREPAPG